MIHIVVYIGKDRQPIIDERHEHELSQHEIQTICGEHRDLALRDIRHYPNRLDYIEYHFDRVQH